MGTIFINSANKRPVTDIFNIKFHNKEGNILTLASYKGKKILIVNTASECGYTPQYAQLQEMHLQMNETVQIVAFPSNDFGAQEPGSDEEISKFCSVNYGVTFPVFSKIAVTGQDMHPLYRWLSDESLNGWNSQPPVWNFCKYLIDEEGVLIAYFSQHVEPASDEVLNILMPV